MARRAVWSDVELACDELLRMSNDRCPGVGLGFAVLLGGVRLPQAGQVVVELLDVSRSGGGLPADGRFRRRCIASSRSATALRIGRIERVVKLLVAEARARTESAWWNAISVCPVLLAPLGFGVSAGDDVATFACRCRGGLCRGGAPRIACSVG